MGLNISEMYDIHLTIEPILEFDIQEMLDLVKICSPVQVNIGADSFRNQLPEPSEEKIQALIDELTNFTKVVQKKNLIRLIKITNII